MAYWLCRHQWNCQTFPQDLSVNSSSDQPAWRAIFLLHLLLPVLWNIYFPVKESLLLHRSPDVHRLYPGMLWKYLRFLCLSRSGQDAGILWQLPLLLLPGFLRLRISRIPQHLSDLRQQPYVPEIRRWRSRFRQDLRIFSALCQGRCSIRLLILRSLRIHRLHQSRYTFWSVCWLPDGGTFSGSYVRSVHFLSVLLLRTLR